MQYDVISFGNNAAKFDVLDRIFAVHPLEIFNKGFFTVRHHRIVLDVNITRIFLDRLTRPLLIEHQIVKSRYGYFVLFEIAHRFSVFSHSKTPLFTKEGGIILRPNRGEHRTLFVLDRDNGDAALPSVTLELGVKVKLRVNVHTKFLTDDKNAYNVLAELPGADLKECAVVLASG